MGVIGRYMRDIASDAWNGGKRFLYGTLGLSALLGPAAALEAGPIADLGYREPPAAVKTLSARELEGTSFGAASSLLKEAESPAPLAEGSSDPHFKLTYGSTPFWMDIGSINSPPLKLGNEVAIIIDGYMVIGTCTVTAPGRYMTSAFGDDPFTPGKQGAFPDDFLEFRVWDGASENPVNTSPEVVQWTHHMDTKIVDIVPEPATLGLLALGCGALLAKRYRRNGRI